MEDHAKKCVGRYCELAKKSIEQLFGVSTPCVDNHQLGEEESESVEESSNVCSCIVLKCLYLGRIGRLDILLSANQLARAVTKLSYACDKCFDPSADCVCLKSQTRQLPGKFEINLGRSLMHFWRHVYHMWKFLTDRLISYIMLDFR